MNKKLKAIEQTVQEYYINKRNLKRLQNRLSKIRNDITDLKAMIKNSCIRLYDEIKSPSFDNESSGNSFATSKIEQSLEKAFDNLEKQLSMKIEEETYIINEIYELEDNIELMNNNIETLRFDLREVIELRYKDKKSVQNIAIDYYGGVTSTVYRKIEKALREVDDFQKIYQCRNIV